MYDKKLYWLFYLFFIIIIIITHFKNQITTSI